MITWALNANYDTYLDDNGNIAIFINIDEIKQSITNILKLWLDEADFDTTEGVDYPLILGQTAVNKNVINTNIIAQIQAVNGVNRVLQSDYKIIDNNLIITTQVQLENGVIIDASSK
jgi:hypothetical protein